MGRRARRSAAESTQRQKSPEQPSVEDKVALVVRVLCGETLAAVSRDPRVSALELDSWVKTFFAAGTGALRMQARQRHSRSLTTRGRKRAASTRRPLRRLGERHGSLLDALNAGQPSVLRAFADAIIERVNDREVTQWLAIGGGLPITAELRRLWREATPDQEAEDAVWSAREGEVRARLLKLKESVADNDERRLLDRLWAADEAWLRRLRRCEHAPCGRYFFDATPDAHQRACRDTHRVFANRALRAELGGQMPEFMKRSVAESQHQLQKSLRRRARPR